MEFAKTDQARIYEIGRRINHAVGLDQMHAEAELIGFVRELAGKIENRGQHDRFYVNEQRGDRADTSRAASAHA